MTRLAGWLRLLLLASLLAGPPIAAQPAVGPAGASWLTDDGLAALGARPAQRLRLLGPSLAREVTPHRAATASVSPCTSSPP